MDRLFHPLGRATFKWHTLLLLTVILVVGAGLRFYGLGLQSLWLDEICTWHTASHPTLHQVVFEDRAWNMYPPGYLVFMHFIIACFGDTETVLRFPSAVASSLSLVVIFLLGARLWTAKEGLVASGLTAALLFPIYFAQETRPYGMLLLFVLVATFCWTYVIEDFRRGQRPAWWMLYGYASAAVLCCYWHYFGLLFIALQGLGTVLVLVRRRRALLWTLGMYCVIVAAFSPWFPSMWWHWSHQGAGPQNPPVETGVLVSFFDYVSSLFSHGQTTQSRSRWVTWAVLALLVLVLAHWVWELARKWREPEARRGLLLRGAILGVWFLAPFLFAYVKSVTGASVFTHRNLTVSMPVVYLLTARALMLIPMPGRTWGRGVLAAVLLAASVVRIVQSGYYTNPSKDLFRAAVGVVVKNDQQYENALVAAYGSLPSCYDYYFKRLGSDRRVEVWAGKQEHIPQVLEALQNKGTRYMWYLCATPPPDNAFVTFLNEHFLLKSTWNCFRVDVYLLEAR